MGIAHSILNPTVKMVGSEKATGDQSFKEVLDWWVTNYQKTQNKYVGWMFPKSPLKKVVAEDRQRYVRISVVDHDDVSGTCIAFIAKKDFVNRTLGRVQRGDIFAAGGCNGPIPERLGNMFTNNKRFFTIA